MARGGRPARVMDKVFLLLFLQKKKTLLPLRGVLQPPRGIQLPHMEVTIPEQALDHRQPLEVMTSAVFHGDADPAMDLDR